MKLLKLIASFAISFSAAGIGTLATTPNIPTWYAQLEKPFFNPPNWVFGPVWTLLYALIAISLYLILINPEPVRQRVYIVFGIQMVLNALWSIVFFGLHLPWLGVIVIAALFISIVYTFMLFRPISRQAAYLLLPYVAWVGYASTLTVAIALLN